MSHSLTLTQTCLLAINPHFFLYLELTPVSSIAIVLTPIVTVLNKGFLTLLTGVRTIFFYNSYNAVTASFLSICWDSPGGVLQGKLWPHRGLGLWEVASGPLRDWGRLGAPLLSKAPCKLKNEEQNPNSILKMVIYFQCLPPTD